MNDSNILWVPDHDDRTDAASAAVLDQLPVIAWRGTGLGQRVFFNRTWQTFTGRNSQEEKGLGWLAGVHPEDRKTLPEMTRSHFAVGQVFRQVYRLRRHDGVYCLIREDVRVLLSPDSGRPWLLGCGIHGLSEPVPNGRQGEAQWDVDPRQQWLKEILSAIHEGILAVDLQDRVTFMNSTAENLLGRGYERSGLVSFRQILRVFDERAGSIIPIPAAGELVRSDVRSHDLTGELESAERQRRPVRIQMYPIRTGNQEWDSMIVVIHDRSELKESETRIDSLMSEYEVIFSGVTTPLFMADVEGSGLFRYRRFNPANEELAGMTTDQILGRTPVEAFGTEIGEDVIRHFQACVDSRKPYTYLSRREFPSGFRVQQVHLTPVIHQDRVVQLVGSAFNLTEQILMEEALRDSEERFRELFNNLVDMAAVYCFNADGPSGPFVEVNRSMQEMLGYSREELLAMGPRDLDAAKSMNTIYGVVKEQFIRNRKADFQGQMVARDGRIIPFEARATLIVYQEQECVLVTLRDISERVAREERIQHHLEIEQATAEVLSLLIRQEQVNFDEICRILGESVGCSTAFIYLYDEEGVYATKIAQWTAPYVKVILPVGRQTDTRRMTWYPQVLRNEGMFSMADIRNLPDEAAAEREDLELGGIRALLNVAFFTRDGQMKGFLGFSDHRGPREWLAEDIELLRSVAEVMGIYFDRRAAEEKIRHISFHDQVTGLFNRAYFEEELKRLDTPRQLPLSILIGDVNGLKLINDAFGHNEGDRFLAKVARTLQKVCRHEDLVARWGGDEFIILLPQTDEQAGGVLIERIRRVMKQEEDELLTVSMALGVATKVDPEQSVNLIIREAEDRMYRNKLLESQSYRSAVISSLESTLWERSNETEEHTRRMQSWSIRLGRKMGLSENRLDELKLLTVLHDIGKIAIPDHILNKPGPLTSEEWGVMRRHAEIGYRIASSSHDLLPIANGILTHHEWWDGNGYPQGLSGEEIPVVARIVAVVDAYDVMLHDRPYRQALSSQEAVVELKRGAGTQFDPTIVTLFLVMLENEG